MRRYTIIICSIVIILLIIVISKFFKNIRNSQESHRYVIEENNQLIKFNLVDPEFAPLEIRESVKRGFHIMLDTPFYAKDYAKNLLSCSSCHFSAGNTVGGRNNGIALVGVTQIYPMYSERSGRTIDLKERIENCFQRSMDGKLIPQDSQIMLDILAYLEWISQGVKGVKNPPWLEMESLKSTYTPDAKKGAVVYQKYCIACHQANGEGGGELPNPTGKTIPPLWGDESFNDGAGMNQVGMLSTFVYWNMPYQNSVLTKEEALDVAAFIIEQPRPHFTPKK